jgi:hypothetical protein
MAKAKLPRLVHVIWFDAHSEDAWTEKKDLTFEPTRCHSVGYLVKRTKHAITVAGSAHGIDTDIDYSCVITIPAGCIRKVKKIK